MNPLRLPRLFSILVLAILVGGSCPGGLAQDQSAPPRHDPYTLSIDFAGGPLSKLVASLNADREAKLSIIQSAGLDPVLPAFSVRDARIESVIVALGTLLRSQGYMLEPTGPNLAVLSKSPEHRGQSFASLPLGNKILGGEANWTVEEIISAIQAGCEFANPDGKPSALRFKYHPATQLLFAAGSEQEIDIAHRVFGSLPQLPSRAAPTPAAEKK